MIRILLAPLVGIAALLIGFVGLFWVCVRWVVRNWKDDQ